MEQQCSNCGKGNTSPGAFCTYCGASLTPDNQQPQSPPPPTPKPKPKLPPKVPASTPPLKVIPPTPPTKTPPTPTPRVTQPPKPQPPNLPTPTPVVSTPPAPPTPIIPRPVTPPSFATPNAPMPAKNNQMAIIIIISGVLAAALVAVILVLLLRGNQSSPIAEEKDSSQDKASESSQTVVNNDVDDGSFDSLLSTCRGADDVRLREIDLLGIEKLSDENRIESLRVLQSVKICQYDKAGRTHNIVVMSEEVFVDWWIVGLKHNLQERPNLRFKIETVDDVIRIVCKDNDSEFKALVDTRLTRVAALFVKVEGYLVISDEDKTVDAELIAKEFLDSKNIDYEKPPDLSICD